MNRFITFMVFVLASINCVAQDDLTMNASYDSRSHSIVVDIKNTSSDTDYTIFNHGTTPETFRSAICISEQKKEKYFDDFKDRFPLFVYDKDKGVLTEEFPIVFQICSHQSKSFGVNLEGREQFEGLKRLYVRVNFTILLILKNGERKDVVINKYFDQYVDIE